MGLFRIDLCHVHLAEDGVKWNAVIFLVQHVPASRVSKAQGSRSPSKLRAVFSNSSRIVSRLREVFPKCVEPNKSRLLVAAVAQKNRSK